MRVVFMGTPEFAVASLEILVANGINIVGVITAPDKPAGRGLQMNQSAIKKCAVKHGLKVLQPSNLKHHDFIKELKELDADLQIVVAFRMLPEIVWNMPEHGTYNLHASLLPKYRGAAPINWAIINGETETGVTTFKLQHQIDTGNILFRERVKIPECMTAGELHDALMITGAQLLLKTVLALNEAVTGEKNLHFIQQDDSEVCHAPKIYKEMCRINWNLKVNDVYNQIRGLSPHPGAYSDLINVEGHSQSVKILGAKFHQVVHTETNGYLTTDNKNFIRVFCDGGTIEITELQLEGKKKLGVHDFLRGFRFNSHYRFS